ncbi:uncharacterized protein EI90DRAFT_3294657 [Cantharellus anzutake]|uniref:uncharacterized protein n=1 Tax=Cantharellus anzutake TaxID=1750568 RepID=UPI001903003D|nr:uncharacterized protein EI90DRAFT_3294657 [Cantharellus anzutake]KAF8312765.1 hypothetical protein EI90DRAFT_3294657 [Cantharellus anzutake]
MKGRKEAAEKRAQQLAREEAQKEREEAARRKSAKSRSILGAKLLSFGDAVEEEESTPIKKNSVRMIEIERSSVNDKVPVQMVGKSGSSKVITLWPNHSGLLVSKVVLIVGAGAFDVPVATGEMEGCEKEWSMGGAGFEGFSSGARVIVVNRN